MQFIHSLALALGIASSSAPALAVDNFSPAETLLSSMRPASDGRQEHIGAAIRALKEQKIVPFRPQRMDYTDYYRVDKPFPVFGHDVLVIEEEYMGAFIGCCVSEGGGFAVRLVGSTKALDRWAKDNKCSVDEFETAENFIRSNHLSFKLPKGRYAEVSCRSRDEDRWNRDNNEIRGRR